MKKIFCLLIAIVMTASLANFTIFANNKTVNPFTDVSEDSWYYDAVTEAFELGLINGKSETLFKPDDLLTYAEAIKLAACMNQFYLEGEVTLKNGTPWYMPYFEYCADNEIITRDYNFTENATRAGYMEIFANALPDEAFEEINTIPDGSILDIKDNAPYAIYVYKLYRAGIVTGVNDKHDCNPDANIKRCEVATIISRMMYEENRKEFNMPGSNESSSNDPIIEDVKINPEHESIVVPPEESPEFDVGDAPTLPGITIENPTIIVVPSVDIDVGENDYTLSQLTIAKQPESAEYDEYGIKTELEVQVFGGKAPYTYEWYSYGFRNQKTKIQDGDYVKDSSTPALILSVEKQNTLLGVGIICKITDSNGDSVTTDVVKIYGPFSMPVESLSINTVQKEYALTGRIADGKIVKGDQVSVMRDGKIIATGVASDLRMFDKSLDEGVKDDRIVIVFTLSDGVSPATGDTVIKYKDTHKIDTSDIVN